MHRNGHLGLGLGFTSIGASYWAHKKISSQPEYETLKERLYHRGKVVLKGLAATGVGVVASLIPDLDMRIEQFGHRRETHSILSAGTVHRSLANTGDHLAEIVKRTCEKLGAPEKGQKVAEQIRRDAGLFAMALSGGLGAHILGDIPTGGQGGSALNLLWPISNKGYNLGLLSSASKTINPLLLKAGGAVGLLSWATVLPRMLLSNRTWDALVERVKSWVKSGVEKVKSAAEKTKDAIKRGAKALVNGLKSLFGISKSAST